MIEAGQLCGMRTRGEAADEINLVRAHGRLFLISEPYRVARSLRVTDVEGAVRSDDLRRATD